MVLWGCLSGVPANREWDELVTDAAANFVVIFQEQLHHLIVIVLVILVDEASRLLEIHIVGDRHALLQMAEKAAEERVARLFLFLALLLGLLGTSSFDLLGHLLDRDILSRLPVDLGHLDLLSGDLAGVRGSLLQVVLLPELGVLEEGILHEMEAELESLGDVRVVEPFFSDVTAVVEYRLIPFLNMILKGRQVLHGLLPKSLEGRRTGGLCLVRSLCSIGQDFRPLLDKWLLLQGELLLQLLDGFFVFSLYSQILVVDLLELLDDRRVFRAFRLFLLLRRLLGFRFLLSHGETRLGGPNPGSYACVEADT
mmetsp:Transcript_8444/g.15436  ORF Transcript_8444/g.15436 Transcript_8444/m.15436 type:complete len:311 (-) Transcript_8444:5-937(-)